MLELPHPCPVCEQGREVALHAACSERSRSVPVQLAGALLHALAVAVVRVCHPHCPCQAVLRVVGIGQSPCWYQTNCFPFQYTRALADSSHWRRMASPISMGTLASSTPFSTRRRFGCTCQALKLRSFILLNSVPAPRTIGFEATLRQIITPCCSPLRTSTA